MLPTPINYRIWPAVIPSDRTTDMTIVPTERAFLPREGESYRLTIIPVDGDEPWYHAPTAHTTLDVTAHDGVLRFTHAFAGEQEHIVLLAREDKTLAELHVYSLCDDLYALQPLRGDLHAHSYRSDGRRDPAALAGHFREQGYDFFALTDHNRFYPGGEIDEVYAGIRTGFVRVRGEEVHAPGSVVHIVHVGGRSSVAELYVRDRAGYEQQATAYAARVPAHVPAPFRERYALAQWATDRIHEAGGLAIFAHPYWTPGGSRMHNVTTEYARLLLSSGMFDAYELVGGMGQAGVNLSLALWQELCAAGVRVPVVGSSDVHGLERSYSFPYYFTLCFAAQNGNDAIVDAVRAGQSVAVEMTGDEYDRHFRCYGSLRLVTYAQFLLRHYFLPRERLCAGEGVAMRAFAVGETVPALIELQSALVQSFTDRFFGRAAPILPTADMLAFEDRWRAVHLDGPVTRGSLVYDSRVSRQI